MLAINGGPKYKIKPFNKGKRFDGKELEYLQEALEQNTLFYHFGTFVKRFTRKFAEMYGMKYCVATSSGTASVHTALGALGIGPGDEVIVPPITDMGGIIGILYQNAIPVFADVDPHTYNMTAEGIARVITPRTKAVIVTHLAGNPCDMDSIMPLAREKGLYVIEDCAQSYYSYYKGRLVGTFGDIGCFSTNDFKHISTGDGGMCVMNDEKLYERALKFTDKGYNRLAKTTQELRKVDSLCPNYRMSELQGAVGLAQLDKVEWICKRREELGQRLSDGIRGIDGISISEIKAGNRSSFWFYLMRIDNSKFNGGNTRFAQALTAEGITAEAGYIGRCVYEYELFSDRTVYGHTGCPLDCANYPTGVRYEKGLCPAAEAVLNDCIKINLNEYYTDEDIDDIIGAIRKICAERSSL